MGAYLAQLLALQASLTVMQAGVLLLALLLLM